VTSSSEQPSLRISVVKRPIQLCATKLAADTMALTLTIHCRCFTFTSPSTLCVLHRAGDSPLFAKLGRFPHRYAEHEVFFRTRGNSDEFGDAMSRPGPSENIASFYGGWGDVGRHLPIFKVVEFVWWYGVREKYIDINAMGVHEIFSINFCGRGYHLRHTSIVSQKKACSPTQFIPELSESVDPEQQVLSVFDRDLVNAASSTLETVIWTSSPVSSETLGSRISAAWSKPTTRPVVWNLLHPSVLHAGGQSSAKAALPGNMNP